MYGRRRSQKIIELVLDELLQVGVLSDPLLRFVEQLDGEKNCDPGETVNLAALFSSAGAADDIAGNSDRTARLAARDQNADQVARTATDAGWKACRPDKSLRSGILLLKATTEHGIGLQPDRCRASFQEHGVALTAYETGIIRLSMPAEPLTTSELDLLKSSLISVGAGL
jgi:hypothetical protein